MQAESNDTPAAKRDLDVLLAALRSEFAELCSELKAEINRAVNRHTRKMYMALLGHLVVTLGFIYVLNTQLR